MHGGFCMKKKQLALLLALTLCISLTPVFAASGNDSAGAPECDHFELKTYRETSLGGQLTATDPEGEPVTFKLTTEPMKGSVTVEPGGAFVYTSKDMLLDFLLAHSPNPDNQPEPQRRALYDGYLSQLKHWR